MADTWEDSLWQCENHKECEDKCSHREPHKRQSLHGYYCYEDDWFCAGYLCRKVTDGSSQGE